MKRSVILLAGTMSVAVLSGCWDREYLKDLNLAYSIGFDLTKDKKIKETVELIIPPETEQSRTKNEIHSAEGITTRGASNELRSRVRGNMRVIKNGIQIIGKSLAMEGLKPPMDVNFRDPDNPTSNVRLVITDGAASDIINKKEVGELKIGEFLIQKINSLEKMSLFYPPETMDTVFRALEDPGQDFALPYIDLQGEEVVAKGVALFDDQKYSGALNAEDSIMLVLLKGHSGDNARFTKKIDDGPLHGDISFNVGKKKVKRKFKVTVARNGEVHVQLNIKLKGIIEEYTGTHPLDEKSILTVNKELSKILTDQARSVVRDLQKANCDIFGVGRELIAYHNNVWKHKDWNKDYSEVRFHTSVQVSIISTGIIH
ncbi:Ger(x)C family spore germination protein [Paenibacillus sp. VCA1]|uniref:Ger(x)C family spore germination protein n=1 Tax=Paenibacillus sp. VCA1 TaxID=3039148 RepID=UPI00287215F9|nr:Ger(x)C family spore germination protein [Paenibacillus sp. VCA1]MDR9855263.1 Ger(x)C family spore germination protein [Paenibacillus sp. VCA1]